MMDRINTDDGLFRDGDYGTGVEGTVVNADYMNTLQEEICSVVEHVAIPLDQGDRKQLAQSVIMHVDSVIILRSLPAPQIPAGRTVFIHTRGCHAAGDGGAGGFYWQGNSNELADGYRVINPAGNLVGRWKLNTTLITPEHYGAVSGGVDDDTAALNALSAVSELVTISRPHKILGAVTLRTLAVNPGGKIILGAGASLTVDKIVDTTQQIFDVTAGGAVTVNQTFKRPEWWGISSRNGPPAAKFGTNYLPNVSKTMLAGMAVNIACYGDSTTYGQSTGGGRAESPAPAVMQNLLRSYFNNPNVTVENYGVPGQTAAQRLATFSADLTGSAADVVFINYGLNDAVAYTPYEFKYYLTMLVKAVIDAKKLCVLEASTPVMHDKTNVNSNGIAGVRAAQNAEIVRTVAKEFSIPVVDRYKLFEGLMSDSDTVISGVITGQTAYMSDGVHPTQLGYNYVGAAMASVFMSSFVAKSACVIPVNHGCAVMVGTTDSLFSPLVLTGNLIVTDAVSFSVKIDRPGLDVFAVLAINSFVSPAVSISINGIVRTVNCRDARVPVQGHVLRNEVLISRNTPPGEYVITISGGGVPIEAEGLAIRESIKPASVFTSNEEEVFHSTNYGSFTAVHTWVAASVEASSRMKVDCDNSFDLEFKAKLAANDGIALFCLPYFSSNMSTSGMWVPIVFQLDASGHPCYSWNWILTGGAYTLLGPADTVVSTATDYRGVEHQYRLHFEVTTGVLTLFIDGVAVGGDVIVEVGSRVHGGLIATKKASSGRLVLRDVTYTPYV